MNILSSYHKVPVRLLHWCNDKEIIEYIKFGKVDEEEVNKRFSYFLYLKINEDVEVLSGKQAKKRHQEIMNNNNENPKDLQGIGASQGKVVARAFVALTPDSASKINKGDVLITGMTTPDFVLSMKKASAIVTDEGGITCHAAIISRELNIPCVVGTKYATRSIKTGELVEVSANHGVVKIIKE